MNKPKNPIANLKSLLSKRINKPSLFFLVEKNNERKSVTISKYLNVIVPSMLRMNINNANIDRMNRYIDNKI